MMNCYFLVFVFLFGSTILSATARSRAAGNCPSCVCGRAKTKQRIVAGTEANPYDFPWMTYITFETPTGQSFCGGTIISDRHVLTAAHCSYQISNTKITVNIFVSKVTDTNDGRIVRKVAKVINHENYDQKLLVNDIALLELDQKVDFTKPEKSKQIVPMCLAPAGQSYKAGMKVLATGYGRTSKNGQGADTLRKVTVPIVSKKDCANRYGRYVRDTNVCAGAIGEEQSTCFGDSGGPLQYINETTNAYQEIGIVSFGAKCGNKKGIGVLTKVSSYRDWIAKNTKGACFCSVPEGN